MQLILGIAALASVATAAVTSDAQYRSQFADFKRRFGRTYASTEEEAARFALFRVNLDLIEETNAQRLGYTMAVGAFADLSETEFMSRYTSPSPPPVDFAEQQRSEGYLGEHVASDGEALPESLDWVSKGAVTAVKDQRCGNCWTFSACGSLEGAVQIKTGKLTNFSEQEFVDCVDDGCNGGWNFNALKFAVNHTVCTLDAFPCLAPEWKGNGTQCDLWEDSPCSKKKGALVKGALSGWKSVGGQKWGETTEADLMSALQQGPVSINMLADSHMGHYSGGVLSYANCSAGTNHGVLAVGYGTCSAGSTTGPCANVTKSTDYWKVKNSWGTTFGVDGYFYLERGKFPAGCGPAGILLTNPSYPVVA